MGCRPRNGGELVTLELLHLSLISGFSCRTTFNKELCDVGPFFHPAMGRVPIAFEPLRLGDATGALRGDPSRCITETLRFA
jgi:hypothetical protein